MIYDTGKIPKRTIIFRMEITANKIWVICDDPLGIAKFSTLLRTPAKEGKFVNQMCCLERSDNINELIQNLKKLQLSGVRGLV